MITAQILIIFFLILVNAFFAMSEIAVVSASKPLLKQLAKQGDARAEAALALAEDPGRFLSTVQVGITLVGILAGAFGGATLGEALAPTLNEISFIAPHGQAVAFAIVVTGITYFSVVVGELVPKQFAIRHAERIAMTVTGPMRVLSIIVGPFVAILKISAEILLRFIGVKKEDGHEQVTEEEVRAILSESAESGVIEKSEHEMLQRVIALGDRDVKSIMTHRQDVTFIDINDETDDIRTRLEEAGHSRYPVIDGSPDNVVGIVQAKDLLDSLMHGRTLDVRGHVKDVYILPENTSCLITLDRLKSSSINMIVVVDEYGSTQGIVTPSDFLEAIVGVLPSNYDGDHEAMQIVQREDGSWLIDGRTPIEEIELTLGINEFEADVEYDTLAGFILESLSRTPQVTDAFEAYGYRYEVVDMDGHRIDKVLVSRLSDESEPDGEDGEGI